MSAKLRSTKNGIFLVGDVQHQINGSKLPSNGQVLAVLFYNIREVKLTINESANLAVRKCIIFWEKARIPNKSLPNCVKKLVDLYQVWRGLQKNANKTQNVFKQRQQAFTDNLDNLFDIAHADALQLIKIEGDKIFLKHQRESGRVGYLGGVDKKLSEKEKRAKLRATAEENRRMKYLSDSNSLVSNEPVEDDLFSISNENIDSQDNQQTTIENTQPETRAILRKTKNNFITSKLVAALDRCQLSIRDSVFILQATIEALGYNTDEYPISKSSIHRIRTAKRKERVEAIKIDFKNEVPDIVTVHWDGKLLPTLNARNCKE